MRQIDPCDYWCTSAFLSHCWQFQCFLFRFNDDNLDSNCNACHADLQSQFQPFPRLVWLGALTLFGHREPRESKVVLASCAGVAGAAAGQSSMQQHAWLPIVIPWQNWSGVGFHAQCLLVQTNTCQYVNIVTVTYTCHVSNHHVVMSRNPWWFSNGWVVWETDPMAVRDNVSAPHDMRA